MSSATADTIVAVCAVAQTTLLLVAGAYGIRQLREARRGRHLAAFYPLSKELQSSEAVNARKRLYLEIAPNPALVSDNDRDLVNNVVNQFDFLGYMARVGAVETEIVLGLYYGTILRCWHATAWYIDEQRELRRSAFAEHFDWLAKQARRFQQQKHPADEAAEFDYRDVAAGDSVET